MVVLLLPMLTRPSWISDATARCLTQPPLWLTDARLSNDVPMSAPSDSDNGAAGTRDTEGVLANLPRTRPQRSSARRNAAREAAASDASQNGPAKAPPARSGRRAPSNPPARARASAEKAAARGARSASGGSGRPAPKATRPSAAGNASGAARAGGARASGSGARKPKAAAQRPPRRADTVSEAVPRQGFESDGERMSGSVQPPGAADMLATAAEIVSELAKAGVSTGERLVRDAFARLPLS